LRQVFGTCALLVALLPVAVSAQQPQTPRLANTAPATDTTAGSAHSTESGDDIVLKRTQVLLGILVAVVGLVLYWWKGMHWAAFTPLESAAGGERLRKIVEGELQKNSKALMELVHKELNNPAAHKVVAEYVVAHWLTGGRDDIRKLIFSILYDKQSETDMMELVARYVDVREDAKKLGQKSQSIGRKLTRRHFDETSLRDRMVESSKIGGEVTDEPARSVSLVLELYKAIRQRLDNQADDTEDESNGD
jgi:hypothetical protein